MRLILFIVSLSILTPLILRSQSIASVDSINAIGYNDLIANLEENKTVFTQTIIDAESIDYQFGVAKAHEKLAIIYFYLKEVDKGLVHSIEAVSYFEAKGDLKGVANVYSDIGFAIKDIQLDKSLEYFRKALKIGQYEELGLGLAKIFNNYGTLLKLDGKLDSALYYHQASLDICYKYNDLLGAPYSLNNAAMIYSAKGEYVKAFELLDVSDSIRILENNDLSWGDNLAYRADVFFDMQNYDSAVLYYEQALVLSKKSNFQNLTTFALDRISQCYEKLDNAEQALKYYKELKYHQDSILSLETNKAIAQLQEEFNVAQKEKKIVEQALELEHQNRRFLYGVLVVSILILILVWFLLFLQRKRKRERIRLQHQKALEKAEMEKSFVEEKLRIGRELHDNIGSQLTFMISSVDNLSFLEKEENKLSRLNRISDFGRSTMKELRSTIWAMKNDGGTVNDLVLKVNELKLAIHHQCDVQVINDVNRELNLNALQMLNLFRIVQEALQNIVKYAEATEAIVKFVEDSNHFKLEIVDNGKGFEVAKESQGNGLNNMKRRCEDCGGTFHINSSPSGTIVTCLLNMS